VCSGVHYKVIPKTQVIQSDTIAGARVSGLSRMVIVHLMLQHPLCEIVCRQILEMRRFLKLLNPL